MDSARAKMMLRRVPASALVIASAATCTNRPWGLALLGAGFLCSAIALVAVWHAQGLRRMIFSALFFAGPTMWVWGALKIWFGSSLAASATALVVWVGLPQSIRSWARAEQDVELASTTIPPANRRPQRKIRF